jgi:glycosyltransferase involved in cell wall biosynthesis
MNLSLRSKNSARKKHLVFINYYFPPMGGGGVQRITKFLKYFDYHQYDVSVITVQPSFFYSKDPTLIKEIPAVVNVIRTGSLDPFRLIFLFQKFFRKFNASDHKDISYQESGGKIRKIAMSIFVPDSRLLWLPFALTRLWCLKRDDPVDVVIASMPPFTAGLIGILGKIFIKAPVILDFRDAWTNNPYLPGIGKIQGRLNEKIEAFCINRASGIVFVNPALERYYRGKYHRESKPCRTIRNGFDPDDFPAAPSANPQENLLFKLGIMGTIYSQGNVPLTLLKALETLHREDTGFKDEFRLVLLGKWSSDFREWVEKQGIRELVEFIPYHPHREALQLASRFDALALAIDSRLPGSSEVTPGRIYEYLYLKKPILALCPPKSDLADLVRQNKAGEVVDFSDVDTIRQVLKNWVKNRPFNPAKHLFRGWESYSRVHQTASLIEFVEEVLSSR